MGHSSLILALSLTLGGMVAMSSCAPPPPQPAAPQVVAPRPKEYTCEFMRKAAAEYAALPPGSALAVVVADGGDLRDRSRAALGLPQPAPCPQ